MNHVFIINGYGVPKDIFTDDNYRFYLNTVFNQIWDMVANGSRGAINRAPTDLGKTLIIFCGGRTDCFSPYRRTEAGEMKKYFSRLTKRPAVRGVARSWKLFVEERSLSLLENLLNAKALLKKLRIQRDEVALFHEWTRRSRVKKVARLVLKGYKLHNIPIDFDVTANRYLSKGSLRKREAKMLKLDLWVLKDQKRRMKQLHRCLYHKKIYFLRRAGGANHTKALKEWWEKELGSLIPR